MLSNPCILSKRGSWARAVVDRRSVLNFVPIILLSYIFSALYVLSCVSSFISLPCLILGVPVLGCLGGHSCGSSLFLVCSRAVLALFSDNTTIGTKLCNLCVKKKKCWGVSKPVPRSEDYHRCSTLVGIFYWVLCSKSHFLAYIWACCYFFGFFW